jgi:hypothetical protein
VRHDESGRPSGIRYILDFDQNLDPTAAENADAFSLFASGGDRIFYDGDDLARTDKIISITYRDANALLGIPARLEVLVTLAGDGSDNDDYELTGIGAFLVDRAGNPLTGGDVRLRFHYEVLPPIVESAFLISPYENQLPDRVLVQFRDLFGLADIDGKRLRDGDHVLQFTLNGARQGEVVERRGMQPNLNPNGPVLQLAAVVNPDGTNQIVLTWSHALTPAEALRGSNYVIVTPGQDGILNTADDHLIVFKDEAIQYVATDRQVILTLPAALGQGTFALRLDGTGDTDLDESSVRRIANYRLDRVDPLGNFVQSIPLAELHYNAYGDRVVLRLPKALPPGRYRLEVTSGITGLTNRTAARLDGNDDGLGGDSFVRIFDVEAILNPNAPATLDPDAFERNHAALEALSYQVEQQVIVGTKALADVTWIEKLVQQVQILTLGSTANSELIASLVNEALKGIFAERLEQLPFIPNEFVLVWSHNARFRVENDAGEIGLRLDGRLLDDLLAGGVLSTADLFQGFPSIAVALVPIDPADSFFMSGPAVRVDGLDHFPNLDFSLEIEGLFAANQLGLIYFGAQGLVDSTTYFDVPLLTRREEVQPPDGITGFDPALFIVDQQVMAEVEEVVGPFNQLQQNLLVMWVDPIDFVLRTPQGQQAGAVGTQTLRAIPGGYYSGNGYSELLIVPNAVSGVYQISFVGLGLPFRGAVHFEAPGSSAQVPFQGLLAAQSSVVIQLNFSERGTTLPPFRLPDDAPPPSPGVPPLPPSPDVPPMPAPPGFTAVLITPAQFASTRTSFASASTLLASQQESAAATLTVNNSGGGAGDAPPNPPSPDELMQQLLQIVSRAMRRLLTDIPAVGRVLFPLVFDSGSVALPQEGECDEMPEAERDKSSGQPSDMLTCLVNDETRLPVERVAGLVGWWNGILGLASVLLCTLVWREPKR